MWNYIKDRRDESTARQGVMVKQNPRAFGTPGGKRVKKANRRIDQYAKRGRVHDNAPGLLKAKLNRHNVKVCGRVYDLDDCGALHKVA